MNKQSKPAALPVGLHQEAGRQPQELVVLHIQDLHGGPFQTLRKPGHPVVSCQQFPETTVAKQAVWTGAEREGGLLRAHLGWRLKNEHSRRRLKITSPRNLNAPEQLQIHFKISSKFELFIFQCFPYFKKKEGGKNYEKDYLTKQLYSVKRKNELHEDAEGSGLILSASRGDWEATRSHSRSAPRAAQSTGRFCPQKTLKKHSWAIFTYRTNIQWGCFCPNKLLPMPTEKTLHFPQLHFTVIIRSFLYFLESDYFYFLIDFILDQSRLPSKENRRAHCSIFFWALNELLGSVTVSSMGYQNCNKWWVCVHQSEICFMITRDSNSCRE